MPPRKSFLNAFFPNADLGRVAATLQSGFGGSPGGQRAGLATLRASDDQRFQEQEEANRQAREAETFERQQRSKVDEAKRNVWKERLKQKALSFETETDPGQRTQTMLDVVAIMKHMKFEKEEISDTFERMRSRPIPTSEEAKKLQGEIDKELIGRASFESLRGSGGDTGKLEPKPADPVDPKIVSAGAALVSPEGKVLFKNPAKRSAAERKLDRADEIRGEAPAGEKRSARVGRSMAEINAKIAAGELSKSDGEKRRRRLTNAVDGIAAFDGSASRALDIINKNPASITVSGDLARGVDSMLSNFEGLTKLLPNVDPNFTVPNPEDYRVQLRDLSKGNQEMATIMWSLAIQDLYSQGLTGGRVSNFLLQRALKNVAASSKSPQTIKNKLMEIRTRLDRNLDIALRREEGDFSSVDQPAPGTTPVERKPIEEMTLEEKLKELEGN